MLVLANTMLFKRGFMLLGVAAAWPQEKQKRTSMMNIRSFIGVACAAVAIATAMPAAAQDGETVTPYFNQAIPNIPGKSFGRPIR